MVFGFILECRSDSVRNMRSTSPESPQELEAQSIPLFTASIRRFIAYQKAALSGVPVYQADDPRAQDEWEDYMNVGKEILP